MPNYRWERHYPGTPFPYCHAIKGGEDIDGCTIYIGRGRHEGDILPAKLIPERNFASVAWDGGEHEIYTYDILIRGPFAWEFCRRGEDVPPNAVIGGETVDGEPLYIGRTTHAGGQILGKIHRSHQRLYFPFGGRELNSETYEVLLALD